MEVVNNLNSSDLVESKIGKSKDEIVKTQEIERKEVLLEERIPTGLSYFL